MPHHKSTLKNWKGKSKSKKNKSKLLLKKSHNIMPTIKI